MTAITSACWTVFECWEICVTCNPRRSLLRFCIHKTSLCEHTFLRPCCACMTILFCCRRAMAYGPTATPSISYSAQGCVVRDAGSASRGDFHDRDPSALPILLRLLRLPSPFARQAILQLCAPLTPHRVHHSFLKMLDDPHADNAFIAMQALIELAGAELSTGYHRCRCSARIPTTTRQGVVSVQAEHQPQQ